MKFKGNILNKKMDYDTKKVIIEIELNSNSKAIDEIKKEKLLDISIDYHRNKRSLDANAYFWVLCEELAKALNITKNEVYKEQIKAVGKSVIVPLKDGEEADYFIQAWENKGIGYLAENLHKSKTEGYTYVRLYYGSSCYNTKDMSRLIDNIVYECKHQGIETATPEELERLKQEWKN